jgi:ADP-ribose pyrophosphatase
MLSKQQEHSLSAYFAFLRDYPQLFLARQKRPIVTDRDVIEQFVDESQNTIGVLADTRYLKLVNDLVETSDDERRLYSYLRVIQPSELDGGKNVAVVPVIADPAVGPPGHLVLVEQERHATGRRHIELPRGFGVPSHSGQANALKELQEETGCIGGEPVLLATVHSDSGLTASTVDFYFVPVIGQGEVAAEPEEAWVGVLTVSRTEVWEMILDGRISDSFTIQGVALLEHHSCNPWA